MLKNKKYYDITAIHPTTGMESRFSSVSQDKLYQNDSGETLFRFNKKFDSVEVITAELIPREKIDAEYSYYKKFGTHLEG